MEQSLREFVDAKGILRTADVEDAGYYRVQLTRLVHSGQLVREAPGVYMTAKHEVTEWHDLAILSLAIPNAVVSLISALAFHGVGTQLPREHWITVPQGSRIPKFTQPMRVMTAAEDFYATGIELHDIESVNVAVYSIEKTIADCFKHRSKVGIDVAVEALKDAWQQRCITLAGLSHFAHINRVYKVMEPYMHMLMD
jgi:predicted transcriptional regulator of viral defense system